MKHAETTLIILALEKILRENTDPDHYILMPQIQAMLEEEGIKADRRTIYKSFENMRSYGMEIVYRQRYGYYMEHRFSEAEALFLLESIRQSPSISEAESRRLEETVLSSMSFEQRKLLSSKANVSAKAPNDTLEVTELLLRAIGRNSIVSFRYFDHDASGKIRYRRNRKPYTLLPCAVVSEGGRFYCVFYSDAHKGFSNYRIDKMDQVTITEETAGAPAFSLENHLRSSFQMYTGEPATVTARFDQSMGQHVFDRFGSGVIITKSDDEGFTASIPTAITPTLISWILNFEDQITVLNPPELVDSLNRLADNVIRKYKKEPREGELK